MQIQKKILMDKDGLQQCGPINIVVFGDSVTHGALNDDINYETVYWNLLRKKLNQFRDYVPVNVINAAISGTTAGESVSRMETQVFNHSPDLVIVCFGLNDVNNPLEWYLDALRQIFDRCKAQPCDVIFMTPNMLNTYVAEDVAEKYRDYAYVTAEVQNGGKMDRYIAAAVTLAESMDVLVCDCYAKWKELAKTQDITLLLANRINHPIPEMHRLFADALYDIIMKDVPVKGEANTTIFNHKE